MTTRERIIHLLHARGLTQTELAERVGIAYSTLRSYLDADSPRLPSVDTALKIASALDVLVESLWGDSKFQPHQFSNLSFLPDAVILEEALRRKAAARSALDSAIEKYVFLAEQIKRLLQSGDLDPMGIEHWSLRSVLDQLAHSASTYGPMLNAWARVEGIWEARNILRSPEKAEGVEMQRVVALLEEVQDDATREGAVRELLTIWGVSEDRIKDLHWMLVEAIEKTRTRSK